MSKSKLATDILSYLIEHPLAEDTVDGIVEWWVLKQSVDQRVSAVRDALAKLVAGGLVLETKRKDGRVYYQLNQSTIDESQRIVANQISRRGRAVSLPELGILGIICYYG